MKGQGRRTEFFGEFRTKKNVLERFKTVDQQF